MRFFILESSIVTLNWLVQPLTDSLKRTLTFYILWGGGGASSMHIVAYASKKGSTWATFPLNFTWYQIWGGWCTGRYWERGKWCLDARACVKYNQTFVVCSDSLSHPSWTNEMTCGLIRSNTQVYQLYCSGGGIKILESPPSSITFKGESNIGT